MLHNLTSNAIKFNKHGGSIDVFVSVVEYAQGPAVDVAEAAVEALAVQRLRDLRMSEQSTRDVLRGSLDEAYALRNLPSTISSTAPFALKRGGGTGAQVALTMTGGRRVSRASFLAPAVVAAAQAAHAGSALPNPHNGSGGAPQAAARASSGKAGSLWEFPSESGSAGGARLGSFTHLSSLTAKDAGVPMLASAGSAANRQPSGGVAAAADGAGASSAPGAVAAPSQHSAGARLSLSWAPAEEPGRQSVSGAHPAASRGSEVHSAAPAANGARSSIAGQSLSSSEQRAKSSKLVVPGQASLGLSISSEIIPGQYPPQREGRRGSWAEGTNPPRVSAALSLASRRMTSRMASLHVPKLALQIVVRDTGIGIAQDKLQMIFAPFAQAVRGPKSLFLSSSLLLAGLAKASQMSPRPAPFLGFTLLFASALAGQPRRPGVWRDRPRCESVLCVPLCARMRPPGSLGHLHAARRRL